MIDVVFRNWGVTDPKNIAALQGAWPDLQNQVKELGILTDPDFHIHADVYCDPDRLYLFDLNGDMHTFVVLPHEGLAPETVPFT